MSSGAWSAIISGVALVAAVLSPVITTLLNNIHESKMYNKRYYAEHRAETIENYLRSAGSLNAETSRESDFREYGKFSKEIYLYIPETLWKYIDDIDSALKKYEYKTANNYLQEFCKKLNEYPPRSVKK